MTVLCDVSLLSGNVLPACFDTWWPLARLLCVDGRLLGAHAPFLSTFFVS